MWHKKYGHIVYRAEFYHDGYRTPSTHEFETWQAAYAFVKREIRDNAAGLRGIDVVKTRFDGFIHTGIFRWDPANGRTV